MAKAWKPPAGCTILPKSAASLLTPAHLYIWDEPLNYIDVFSRMQIEQLFQTFLPTMLVVEHDVRFREQIATKVIEL